MTRIFRNIRNWFSQNPETLTLAVYSTIVVASVFGSLLWLAFWAPTGTEYRFSDGFYYDYYHYLMKVKSGMMGHIGYYNRYTDIVEPATLGHIVFSLVGWIGAHLGIQRTDIIYLLFRFGSVLVLFGAFRSIVHRIFFGRLERIIAFTFLFASTGLYTVNTGPLGFTAVEAVTFSSYYNAYTKFSAPPHHLLSVGLLLLVSLLVLEKNADWKTRIGIAAGTISIGMLHPIILLAGALSWGVSIIWLWVERRITRTLFTSVAIFIGTGILPILYYAYLFSSVLPWTIWARTTLEYNYQIDWWGLLFANGLFLPFLILSVAARRTYPGLYPFLFAWGIIVPVALFPFATMGTWLTQPRLLQLQQYIPLSLLSAMGIIHLLARVSPKPRAGLGIAVCILIAGFAVFPWYSAMRSSSQWKQPNFYNVFFPADYLAALTYLEQSTPPESVVLAGEYMSATIPAFTHNRVILGRGDVAEDYTKKLVGLYRFFGSNPDPAGMQEYLMKYHVDYIIFGIDSPAFRPPYSWFTFFQSVFRSGDIDVVRVLR